MKHHLLFGGTPSLNHQVTKCLLLARGRGQRGAETPGAGQAWGGIPAPAANSRATLGKSINLPGLQAHVCKRNVVTVSLIGHFASWAQSSTLHPLIQPFEVDKSDSTVGQSFEGLAQGSTVEDVASWDLNSQFSDSKGSVLTTLHATRGDPHQGACCDSRMAHAGGFNRGPAQRASTRSLER